MTHCLVWVEDKMAALSALQAQLVVSTSQTIFAGADLNDLPVRSVVGLLFSPTDNYRPICRVAKTLMQLLGSHVAHQELVERMHQAWNNCIERIEGKK